MRALLMETPTAVVAEDDKGRTPLHLAASNGHADCVSELYICGAEMENADERGFRARTAPLQMGILLH